jgi:hypothetical protein
LPDSQPSRSCDIVLFIICYTGMFILLPSILFDCASQNSNTDVIIRRGGGGICDIGGSDRCFAEESS